MDMKLTKLDRQRMDQRDAAVEMYMAAGYLERDAYKLAEKEFSASNAIPCYENISIEYRGYYL